jgi:hypothetical protein
VIGVQQEGHVRLYDLLKRRRMPLEDMLTRLTSSRTCIMLTPNATTHIYWMLTLVTQVVLLRWLQIQMRTRLCSGNISIHRRGNGASSHSTSPPRLTGPLRHHHRLWNIPVPHHTELISAHTSIRHPSFTVNGLTWLRTGRLGVRIVAGEKTSKTSIPALGPTQCTPGFVPGDKAAEARS